MKPTPILCRRLPLAVLLLTSFGTTHAEDLRLQAVEVIGTTPLPGIGLPRDQVPANLQTLDAATLKRSGDPGLAGALEKALPSVSINEIQGNPYQADLNYRGFTASPLLGTAQGVSVFLDGVRINEGFGDVVNWDLIPRSAIAGVTLSPGSNPLYGLNTLGGALALQTKDGRKYPGGELEVSAGAFGRRSVSLQQGGSKDALSWYGAVEGMQEDGWRDHSPSEVGQFFGKLGWQDMATDVTLTLAHANTDLIGNGLLPESMLAAHRSAIFTHPDQTANRLTQVALTASHWASDDDQITGTAYLRRTRSHTLNGDANDDFEDGPFDGLSDEDSGVLNRTATDQNAYGLSLQWTHSAGAHQFALGISHDRSHARFSQSAQEGTLNASRGVSVSADEALENALHGYTRTTSAYLTDTFAASEALHLTASARFNHTRVVNRDQVGSALNGDFTYDKLNPALGLTWQLAPAITLYGGLSQGNRAPTPIELGCADPANPCTLPNALAADPYLKQVVARTLEVGLRGKLAEETHWNANLFRTTNQDDILFVGTSTSAGYFTNFGKTRRQGLELGLGGNRGSLDWRIDYSYLLASFQSSACLLAADNSSAGSSAACGADEILVGKGDRLPGLPRHSLKLAADWQAQPGLRLGADVVAYSNRSVRGNENGQHRPGGDFSGSGWLGGYAVLNLNAEYQLRRGLTLFGRIDNVFDKRYATAGALAENPFDARGAFLIDSGDWRSEQFVAPGAPRAAWIGLRFNWGS